MQQGLHELQGSARYLAHILLLQGLGLGHVGKLQTWGVGGGGGVIIVAVCVGRGEWCERGVSCVKRGEGVTWGSGNFRPGEEGGGIGVREC